MNDESNEAVSSLVFRVGLWALMAGLFLILAFPFKWCWNYSMPYVFKLPEIGWGHAFCLLWVLQNLRTTVIERSKP